MISLVSTVFNDREGAGLFFQRMAAQTRPPDEIVIVDSCSKDGTWEVLQAEMVRADRPWQLVAWQERCNVARGRNLAIERAVGPVIASTDLGCDWDAKWIEELIQPLQADEKCLAVMGSWAVRAEDLEGPWAKIEYAWLRRPALIATPSSLSSSRSIAYRRETWLKVGGYPEDLTIAGDDAVFGMLLHKFVPAARKAAAPDVRCYWTRHATFEAFRREARRNFFGAGEALIWADYPIKVAARIGAEAGSMCLGLSLLFLHGSARVLGAVVLLGGIGLVITRLRRLGMAVGIARELGVSSAWARLIAFEYVIKVWSIIGYWQGWRRGAQQCRECRLRLRAAGV